LQTWSFILRCLASQEWNGTFPVCKQVLCGPLPDVSFGGPSSASAPFPFNSVVTYKCMDGFTLRKEDSVSCLSSGKWSHPYPECIPVECPQPVEISNGIVDVQGLMYLSKALYSCKTGYQLVGNATVLCGEKGLWIGGVPSCRPVECSPPKEIANGKAAFTKLQFGHSVTYSCRRGFRLQGPETLKCLASGEWSAEPSVCEQISCTPPQPIENGFVEGQDHSFGVTIFYSCFPGFQLIGQDHLTCEEFGWSSAVPLCVPSDCGLPPHIDFGDYVRATESGGGSPRDLSFLHGTTIEYRCHKGYDLTTPTRLACQEDGSWNGTAPSCVPAECVTPPSPEHGRVNGEPVRQFVHYMCNPGFLLKGADSITCQADGKWTGPKPRCEFVSCGPPTLPSDITFKGQDFVYNEEIELMCQPEFGFDSKVMYECEEGYAISGDPTRRCQSDGRWDKPAPRCEIVSCDPCEPVSCGKPPDVAHSQVEGEAYTFPNLPFERSLRLHSRPT
uniref:Sushi domain-containing protein n=1 Tax=Hippocampus comes TaxID=109280 RepID=A0A3Q2XW70_HIPCM